MSADERLQVTLDKIAFELERLALIAAVGAMNADRNPFERQQIDAAKSLEFEPSYASRLKEREELVSRLETELQAAGAQLDVQDERIRTLEAQLVTLDEAQKQLAWKDEEIANLRRIASEQDTQQLARNGSHAIELERAKKRSQELERCIHRLKNERDQAFDLEMQGATADKVIAADLSSSLETVRKEAADLRQQIIESRDAAADLRREAANSESRANQLHRELETCRRAAADDANYRIESDKKLKKAQHDLEFVSHRAAELEKQLKGFENALNDSNQKLAAERECVRRLDEGWRRSNHTIDALQHELAWYRRFTHDSTKNALILVENWMMEANHETIEAFLMTCKEELEKKLEEAP